MLLLSSNVLQVGVSEASGHLGCDPASLGERFPTFQKECGAFIFKGQVKKLISEPPWETVLGISLSRCRRGGDEAFVSSVVN